jgi:peptidyl-tRNA hydrolase, PTH1 family
VDIKIIAGLGNPGREYESTRHNVGFMLLDRFAARKGVKSWRRGADFLLAESTNAAGGRLLLVKPQSFMNCSGGPLAEVMRFFRYAPQELLVLHDDIDLPLGTLRTKSGGGDGGHNGVRSITEMLGSQDFVRSRVGVGRPVPPVEQAQPEVVDWVLGCFDEDEKKVLAEVLERGVQLIEEVLSGSLESAQRKFNG